MAARDIFLVLLWIPECILSLNWQTTNNITLPEPLARSPVGTTLQNDYLYIFGGQKSGENDNSYMNVTNVIYKWWLDNNNKANWIVTNISMPANKSLVCNAQCSVTINNSIYIIIPSTPPSNNGLEPNLIYKFDTNTLNWTLDLKNTMRHSIDSSACVTTNNTHIFVLGGLLAGKAVNYNQIYNIDQDQWSLGSTLRSDNWYQGSCMYHNKTQTVYVFGGETVDPNNADNIKFWATIYKYFPINDSWHESDAALSVARSGSYAVSHLNKIYVIGGYNRKSNTPRQVYYDIVDVYDILSDECNSVQKMTKPKAYPMALINNSYIYVLGGEVDIVAGTSTAYKIVEMANLSIQSNSFWTVTHIVIGCAILFMVLCAVMFVVLFNKCKCKDKTQDLVANGVVNNPIVRNANPHDEVPYQDLDQEGKNQTEFH